MKRSVIVLGLVLTLSAAIVSSCGAPSPTPAKKPTPIPAGSPVSTPVEMANPAPVYCQEQGYTLEMRTDASGGQYGVCIFPDGSECDEWAFYRGECGPNQAPAPAPTESSAEAVDGWVGKVVKLP